MDFTQEQLEKLRQKLPKELVDQIASFEISFIVQEMCAKYHTMIDETDEIYKLVLQTIIGELNPKQFPEKMKTAVPEVKPEDQKAIIEDIDREIFQKLKEHLVQSFAHHDSLIIEDTKPAAAHRVPTLSFESKSSTTETPAHPSQAATPTKEIPMPTPRLASVYRPNPTYDDPQDAIHAQINRDVLLQEIEDPEPVASVTVSTKPLTEGTSNIIEQKLEATVQAPATNSQIESTTKIPPKPTYSSDPYREPIS